MNILWFVIIWTACWIVSCLLAYRRCDRLSIADVVVAGLGAPLIVFLEGLLYLDNVSAIRKRKG